MTKNGKYDNIVALAIEDARESRIVFGKDSLPITDRWYYTLVKWLKILSFAAVVLLTSFAIIAFWLEMKGLPLSEFTKKAISELQQAIIFLSVIVLGIIVCFVLTLVRKKDEPLTVLNIIGASVLLLCCAVCGVFFYNIMSSSDTFYDGGETAFIWRHLVPLAILGASGLSGALMSHIERMGDARRYDMIVAEAFDSFREIKQDVPYTSEEWEEYLSSYTRPAKAYLITKVKKEKSKNR